MLTPLVSHDAMTALPDPTPASVTVPIVAADAKAIAYAQVPKSSASTNRFIDDSSRVSPWPGLPKVNVPKLVH